MSFDIVLKHIGGERKTVPVEYVSPNLTYLTIRWELAGLYDLNLAVNVLTPRNAEGQGKGKAKWYKKDKPQWKAEDIVAVRKLAKEYQAEKRGNAQDAAKVAIERHNATMPGKTSAWTDEEREEIAAQRAKETAAAYSGEVTHAKMPNGEVIPIRGLVLQFKGPQRITHEDWTAEEVAKEVRPWTDEEADAAVDSSEPFPHYSTDPDELA